MCRDKSERGRLVLHRAVSDTEGARVESRRFTFDDPGNIASFQRQMDGYLAAGWHVFRFVAVQDVERADGTNPERA